MDDDAAAAYARRHVDAMVALPLALMKDDIVYCVLRSYDGKKKRMKRAAATGARSVPLGHASVERARVGVTRRIRSGIDPNKT